MAPVYYPDSLWDIAMEVFVPIGLNLLKNLVRKSKDKGNYDANSKYVTECSTYLEKIIDSGVNTNSANEVTERLLNCVLKNYSDVLTTIDDENDKETGYCQDVALSVMGAMIHRSTTVIHFSDQGLCPYREEYHGNLRISLFSVIIMNPFKFCNIKVLKLGDYSIMEHGIVCALLVMKNLEEFSYAHSNKMILETLSMSCKQLRNLDVSHSQLVRSESIQFISSFRCLNRMNVWDTNLDFRKLMSEFIQYEVSSEGECVGNASKTLMNSLECSLPCSDIPLLPDSFPNLKYVIMHLPINNIGREDDVNALKGMTKLSSLTIAGAQYHAKEEHTNGTNITYVHFCRAVGEKLTNLHLYSITNVNLTVIDDNCPMLKELKLRFISRIEEVPENSLPNFCNLHYLKLRLGIQKTTTALSHISNCKVPVLNIDAATEPCVRLLIQKTVKGEIKSLHINGREINVSGNNIFFKGYDNDKRKNFTYSVSINAVEEFQGENFKYLIYGSKYFLEQ